MPHDSAQKPFPRRTPSLYTLPPEILLAIATLLPLASLNALITSSPFFRELHGLTIRKPSFCPWRRRYEFHRNAYQDAYNAAEIRASARRNQSEMSEPGLGVTEPHATQLEYEAVAEGFMRDLGFTDPDAGMVNNDGEGDSTHQQQQPRRRRFLILDEKILLQALMGLWRTGPKKRFVLRLRRLRCDLSALEYRLERLCPWRVIGPFAPLPPRHVECPDSMMMYVLLTVYMLYGGLQPADVPDLVVSCTPSPNRDSQTVYDDLDAAICEYFCFLALFMDIWEAQFMMLELEGRDKATVLQADLWYHGNLRRGLSSKIRKWLDRRFAPAKPLPPPPTGHNNSQILSPKTKDRSLLSRKRSISDTFNISMEGIVHTAPTARSGYERSNSWSLDKQFGGALSLRPYPHQPPPPVKDLLTEEQQRIVDMDLAPGELLKIRAFAGTGKTRSLVEYAKRRPRKSFLYVAFNTSARMDAEKKFGGNVTCRTMHATALRELDSISPIASAAKSANTMPIPAHWGAKDLIALFDLDKKNTITEALENPSNHMQPGERRKMGASQLDPSVSTQKLPFPTATTVATTIKLALENFWASTSPKVTKYCLPYMVQKVGLKPAFVLHWAKLVWYNIEQGTAPWLPHDAYLKLMQLYSTGDDLAFGRYDTIMFDEAQDASPCMASIILRQRQLGRSIIIVGDPYQKIYGFRGAGNDCFDDELYPPTYTCFLTHSFRFGDNIADIANILLRALKEPERIHGVRRSDTVKLAPTAGTLNRLRFPPPPPQSEPFTIIFRKNVSLISTAISFCLSHPLHKIRLQVNRSFTKNTLFTNLRSAHALVKGTKAKSGPLAEWKSWDQLKAHVHAASDSGDDISPLLVLLVGLECQIESEDFLTRITSLERNVLNDDDPEIADVIFTTAHQAKGLEWDRVHVAAADFNPAFEVRGSLCRTKYYREECCLLYVAVTRAKKELLIADPVTSYLAAEEGVVDVRLSPKMEDGKCDRCENEWKDGWLLLEMTRRGLEPGNFDVREVQSAGTLTTLSIRNGSSSPAESVSSTYSDPFASSATPPLSPPSSSSGLTPDSNTHLASTAPTLPTTITACPNCSHVTDHFVSFIAGDNNLSAPPEECAAFLRSRWRTMACWDQVWGEKYGAETLRIKQGLRGAEDGEDETEDFDADGGNGVMQERVEGWWGQKEE